MITVDTINLADTQNRTIPESLQHQIREIGHDRPTMSSGAPVPKEPGLPYGRSPDFVLEYWDVLLDKVDSSDGRVGETVANRRAMVGHELGLLTK
jgi:hypothetical protein